MDKMSKNEISTLLLWEKVLNENHEKTKSFIFSVITRLTLLTFHRIWYMSGAVYIYPYVYSDRRIRV